MTTFGHHRSLAAVIALIGSLVTMPPPADGSVEFTEHFLELEPGSKFRLTFDVNRDNIPDAEATGPLRGRLDADLRLSDTGPSPILEAFRLRRITLRPDSRLDIVGTGNAAGFRASLVNASLHLGDGLGRTGTAAVVTSAATPGSFSWIQPNDNALASRGSLRARGAGGELDELLDLSQADLPSVPLAGSWQSANLGTSQRLTLRYTSNQKLRAIVPITVFIDVTIDATQPLIEPPAPVTYDSWTASAGVVGNAAAPDADQDGDGRPNLVEYGDATNPVSADTALALSCEFREGRPTFLFQRHENRTDLEYILEASDNLIDWKPIAAAVPGADAGGTAGSQVVEESLTSPGVWLVAVQDPAWRPDGPQRFARLVYSRRSPPSP